MEESYQELLSFFENLSFFKNRSISFSQYVEYTTRNNEKGIESISEQDVFTLQVKVERFHTGYKIISSIKNNTSQPIKLHRVMPLCFSGKEIYQDENKISGMFSLGYQSWSPTEFVMPGSKQTRSRAAILRDMSDNSYPIKKTVHDEYYFDWQILIKSSYDNLVVSCLTSKNAITQFHLSTSHTCIDSFNVIFDFDAIDLKSEQMLEIETLYFESTQNPVKSLEDATSYWANHMDVKLNEHIPSGWCSWYRYKTKINQDIILKNLEQLSDIRDNLALQVFQIDDGYQSAIGDWDLLNNRFTDLKEICDQIKERGFTPGIWIAPFIVQKNSKLFKKHPDWLLKNIHGKPRSAGINPHWGGKYYAMDCTNPEFLEQLASWFTLLKEYGFVYFKIDFSYAASLPGIRYDQSISGHQSLRHGLAHIRKTVGDDVYLLGCGMPFGAGVGLMDGMRVSPDVEHSWNNKFLDWLTGSKSYPSAQNAILGIINRSYLHNRLWQNDPDCVILQQSPGNHLKSAEVKSLLTAISLSGGVSMISEDLNEIGDTGFSELERIFPIYNLNPHMVDFDHHHAPTRLLLEHPVGDKIAVCFFNWDSKPTTLTMPSSKITHSVTLPAHLFDPWDRVYYGLWSENDLIAYDIRPHGCRNFIATTDHQRPQVIGIGPQLFYFLSDFYRETYDDNSRELCITLKEKHNQRCEFFIVAPIGFEQPSVRVVNGSLLQFDRQGPLERYYVATQKDCRLVLKYT